MHGRSYLCLLAGILFSASLLRGQSPEAGKNAASASPAGVATKSLAPEFRTTNQTDGAIVLPPVFPLAHGSPLMPAPRPEPLPWRPIYSTSHGFAQLVRAAGIIFSGTVTRVEATSVGVPGQTVGTIAITFRVENAIRGATPGKSLTITQWIGLWSSGQRYRPGERVLLFLYPPSRVGLSSCVGAAIGRFAVDSLGRVSLSPQQILAFRADPVLGGKSRAPLSDFASAVRRAGEEE